MKGNSSTLQRNENFTIPVDSPMYSAIPTIYKKAVFNHVYFITEPDNIADLLPEPFTPGDDGLCAAFSLKMPFSSSYGPFNEMGLVVSAKFQNEKCFYLPALFLDNDSAIAAGREIYGSPKKLVKIILEERNEIFVASCIRNEIEIFRITTKILCPAEESDFPEICPVYNLKMIPSVDKPGADIKQITSTGRNNVKTHWMFKCAGSINFSPTTATNI